MGPVAQWVARSTADLGVASWILAQSHTSVDIDCEIISMVILLLLLIQIWLLSVSCKQKYLHEVLVNCLVKLAQEKMLLGELTLST